jgi:hypothetical protein
VSLDEKRRQKKLAKKAAKRKLKPSDKKDTHISESAGAHNISLALNSPIYECIVPEELFEVGIGNILISRKMPDGNIAFSIFFLDVFCLGVKNAYFFIMPQSEYDDKIGRIRQDADFKSFPPECIRKLVESAEAYAGDLGFNPHPDYRSARMIFGDIDAEKCPMQFEFGKDGRPLFISGPSDTQAKCMKIMETLTKSCGPGGFHYMIGVNREI